MIVARCSEEKQGRAKAKAEVCSVVARVQLLLRPTTELKVAMGELKAVDAAIKKGGESFGARVKAFEEEIAMLRMLMADKDTELAQVGAIPP